jgi:CRP-like cAMP-binding protein
MKAGQLKPGRLREIIQSGDVIKYSKNQFFHSLDFSEENLYVIKSGFAKRYSVSDKKVRAIESIYGPNHFFPLSPVFMNLFAYNLNQEAYTYLYQAMTDLELNSISIEELMKTLKEQPELYADLLYETGRRLKVDINRLTSNALRDDDKKVTHQLFCLAEEFGKAERRGIKIGVQMPVALKPIDFAEQINIEEALNHLLKQGLITVKNGKFYVPDLALLKDAYLR